MRVPNPWYLPGVHTQTTAAVARLKSIWNDRNINLSSKIRPMNSLVLSIFLYACETWTLSADLQRIQAMEMRRLWKILRTSYTTTNVTNKEIRNKIEQAIGPVEDPTTVLTRSANWSGTATSHDCLALAKNILEGGRRRRGRHKKRCEDNIKINGGQGWSSPNPRGLWRNEKIDRADGYKVISGASTIRTGCGEVNGSEVKFIHSFFLFLPCCVFVCFFLWKQFLFPVCWLRHCGVCNVYHRFSSRTLLSGSLLIYSLVWLV